ncbi:MAG: rhodanese-like domain-containing protein [Bacteroidetes bacterium]|nr:MAG: rhodanese-like domain-containing protein [Bacteroidota bacterium]
MENNCKISRWAILKSKLNNLTPGAFRNMMESHPNAILIDCRKPEEFKNGHFRGAVNMDYLGEPFYDQLEALDPSATYLVYCRSGRRSLRTCTLMQNSGFANVYNLENGLNEWVEVFGPDDLEF